MASPVDVGGDESAIGAGLGAAQPQRAAAFLQQAFVDEHTHAADMAAAAGAADGGLGVVCWGGSSGGGGGGGGGLRW